MTHIQILENEGYCPEAINIYESMGNVTLGTVKQSAIDPESVDILVVKLKYHLDQNFLKRYVRLKMIVSSTTGLNHLDHPTINRKNIKIISLRDVDDQLEMVQSAGEFAVGLIISSFRKIHLCLLNENTASEAFHRNSHTPSSSLRDKKLGIIGLGRIGRFVKQVCERLNMEVQFFDNDKRVQTTGGIPLEKLLSSSDIILIAAKHNFGDAQLLNKPLLRLMKPSAHLINIARGDLIDEREVLNLIDKGRLAGYATDVMNQRHPKYPQNISYAKSLISRRKCIAISPHLGGYTYDDMSLTELLVAKKARDVWNDILK